MIAAPFTPRQWQPKLGNKWNQDANNNNVEDKLDSLLMATPGLVIDVVLDLNSCASDSDLIRFQMSGTLGYVSDYISIVGLKDVPIAAAISLGSDPRVAMVEEDRQIFATLDVSTRAMCVRASPTYSPGTVEDQYPAIDGSGIVIGIIDTGVDDGVHESLPAAKFVGGYNTFTQSFGNPDDDNQHGTHVASTALGTGGGAMTFRGVAPNARLVDIKVLDASGSGTLTGVIDGIDRCIQMKNAWNLRIISLSLGTSVNSNGLDAVSEALNRAVAAGIVAVVAVGNNGMVNFIPAPGAADDAITVAAVDDQGSVTRAGDLIVGFSNKGPRLTDGDTDPSDELKPDVAAPGVNIMAAKWNTLNQYQALSGTSMATPHVAGLAALIIQASPSITALAVKSQILQQVEDPLPAGWTADWGQGYALGCTSVGQLITSLKTDLCFDIYLYRPGSPDWWFSPDVVPTNPVIKQGVPNSIQVKVKNCGPNLAVNFLVKVGVYNFSNSASNYNICTISVPSLASGSSVTLPVCNWTPSQNVGTGVVHACLKAEIVYPQDLNPINNYAQHNIDIQHASTAEFKMLIENPLDQDVFITLNDNLDTTLGWVLTKSDNNFLLAANSCPQLVKFFLTSPPAGPFGDTQTVSISVVGQVVGDTGSIDLGGVGLIAIHDCNCGDANGSGTISISDAVHLVNYIFAGGPAPNPLCKGDANGSGSINISDVVFLITYIFAGGTAPHCP